jgi:hypothetical protein
LGGISPAAIPGAWILIIFGQSFLGIGVLKIVSTWTAQSPRYVDQAEQRLYDHLLQLVQSAPPSQLISRFQALFIEGVDYPEPEILAVLDAITVSKAATHDFRFVLNRCCHILINRWQARPQLQPSIAELVALFESPPSRQALTYSRSRSVRRIRSLTQDFTRSEQYLALRRLAQVLVPPTAIAIPDSAALGNLIRRYPYLYEHCLLAEGCTHSETHTVRQLQEKAQRQYEVDLSHYVTYQVRRSRPIATGPRDRVLVPATNPTLLTEADLCLALKHFIGRSQGNYSYRDLAQRFLQSSQTQKYGFFKDDLYQYLTASVDTGYGKRQFNNQLYAQLQNLLPDRHHQPVDEFLMIRTCSQLLNFLVVESPKKPEHFLFVDLIANLGPVLTTGLLLKLVLICRKIRPYLGKRFSILFSHYETCTQEAVMWLVYAMENLNIALSTNLSAGDMSLINQWAK